MCDNNANKNKLLIDKTIKDKLSIIIPENINLNNHKIDLNNINLTNINLTKHQIILNI